MLLRAPLDEPPPSSVDAISFSQPLAILSFMSLAMSMNSPLRIQFTSLVGITSKASLRLNGGRISISLGLSDCGILLIVP